MPAQLVFHGDLVPLLRRDIQGGTHLHDCERRASVKDAAESLGIPHTEIYRIVAGNGTVDFSYLPEDGERIEFFPAVPPVDVTRPTALRAEALEDFRFMVDVNVARLGGFLRLLGFDAASGSAEADEVIADRAAREGRIVLSRDRELLKRKIVTHGRLVRAVRPREQLREVASLFGLGSRARPFTRCATCNGLLHSAAKQDVVDRLEPLTKLYFDDFKACRSCGQVYWKGSHFQELQRLLSDAGWSGDS